MAEPARIAARLSVCAPKSLLPTLPIGISWHQTNLSPPSAFPVDDLHPRTPPVSLHHPTGAPSPFSPGTAWRRPRECRRANVELRRSTAFPQGDKRSAALPDFPPRPSPRGARCRPQNKAVSRCACHRTPDALLVATKIAPVRDCSRSPLRATELDGRRVATGMFRMVSANSHAPRHFTSPHAKASSPCSRAAGRPAATQGSQTTRKPTHLASTNHQMLLGSFG
jgi:hypothetical protein